MPSASAIDPDQPDRTRYGQADDTGGLKGRIGGIAATIAVEIVLILLLLSLGWSQIDGTTSDPNLVAFDVSDASEGPEEEPPSTAPEPSPDPPQPDPDQAEPVEPQPTPDLVTPVPYQPPPLVLPTPQASPRPQPAPTPSTPAKPSPAKPPGRVYGPVDTGPSGGSMDSERVGTAPNGEPMYRARWYREPTRGELAGYLSTARGPGSALIVCRTVPGFYVEDCELLGESPRGSQIGRAVLAAAWQFRVRPAIVGGRAQFGSWVRIRIDYTRSSSL